MSFTEEDLVVRIRGTFIEVHTGKHDLNTPHQNRSSSAPPSTQKVQHTATQDDQTVAVEDHRVTSSKYHSDIESYRRANTGPQLDSPDRHRHPDSHTEAQIVTRTKAKNTLPNKPLKEPTKNVMPPAIKKTKCCTKKVACACGTVLPREAKFCFMCCKAVQRVCPCGTPFLLDLDAKFCTMCGHSSESPPEEHASGIDSVSTDVGSSDGSCDERQASPGRPAGVFHQPSKQKVAVPTKITTLMICDIPCRRTIGQLIEVINKLGFANTYDLVYMPPQKEHHTRKRPQNMGYAFVNFKLPEYAISFSQVFQNFTFPNCESTKLSYTKPAHCQGYKANRVTHVKHRASGCLLTFRNEPGLPPHLLQ